MTQDSNNTKPIMISVIKDMEQIINSMKRIRGVSEEETEQKDFRKMKCSSLYEHFDKQLKQAIMINKDTV